MLMLALAQCMLEKQNACFVGVIATPCSSKFQPHENQKLRIWLGKSDPEPVAPTTELVTKNVVGLMLKLTAQSTIFGKTYKRGICSNCLELQATTRSATHVYRNCR